METVFEIPNRVFSTIDKSLPIPLYYQIATVVEAAIVSAEIPPGAKIENEIDLAKRLGVSRPTIRRAIQELTQKGLLVRRRGIGTQVVKGRVSRDLELTTSLYEDLLKSGKSPATRVFTLEERLADKDFAAHYSVPINTPLWYMRRLRLVDGVPLVLMENYVLRNAVELSEDVLTGSGLIDTMQAHGVAIKVAHQTIGARESTQEEFELLELPHLGAPVLTMERTAFDDSGSPVEIGKHSYRPDLYRLNVTLVSG